MCVVVKKERKHKLLLLIQLFVIVVMSNKGNLSSHSHEDSVYGTEDGAKLRELQGALDGIYDEIMRPGIKNMGNDAPVPRKWEHSKTVPDDVWRKEFNNRSDGKDKSTSDPEDNTKTGSYGTDKLQDVDAWCLRSEDNDDDVPILNGEDKAHARSDSSSPVCQTEKSKYWKYSMLWLCFWLLFLVGLHILGLKIINIIGKTSDMPSPTSQNGRIWSRDAVLVNERDRGSGSARNFLDTPVDTSERICIRIKLKSNFSGQKKSGVTGIANVIQEAAGNALQTKFQSGVYRIKVALLTIFNRIKKLFKIKDVRKKLTDIFFKIK